ncbi:F-box/kelch-repeat protein OR23-like [Aristolochia californica]|uniref:F-box/kelch-repeat protein OR23-like n=1 Tax=Aristolochia californica TaxID=171875 RepID=UPI0035DFA304
MSSSSSTEIETLSLIPGLPNDLAALILSLIPFFHHARLKSTSKSWHSFFSSTTVLPLRRLNLPPLSLSHLVCIFPQDPSLGQPYLFDPLHAAWSPIPPMPCSPHRYGLSNFASVSLGSRLFVLGGSYFDNRSFPIDRPRASASVYALDLSTFTWSRRSPMPTPRGSFACAADPFTSSILVAGGGSRHNLFGSGGSRISAVERYDVVRDEWIEEEKLPRYRAGCAGFMFGEDEFWVMGGYGDSRTISRILPVDEYYKDRAVLNLKSGKWKEFGDMWEEGERWKLGSVVAIDGLNGARPDLFMLDGHDIFRFDVSMNRWWKESTLPRSPPDCSCSFVALGEELYVMFVVPPNLDLAKNRRVKRKLTLFIQVYNHKKRNWRSLITKSPFKHPLDFRTAVMCTVRL